MVANNLGESTRFAPQRQRCLADLVGRKGCLENFPLPTPHKLLPQARKCSPKAELPKDHISIGSGS